MREETAFPLSERTTVSRCATALVTAAASTAGYGCKAAGSRLLHVRLSWLCQGPSPLRDNASKPSDR